MGILTRFKDIMSANINALLDRCEDPSKMIDEYMRQVTQELAEVKKETAGIMAEEKRTKRLLDENNEKISKYEELAKKALTAGSEEDARVFLEKKLEYVNLGKDYKQSYDIAHNNSQKMQEMHDKLTQDVRTLEQRRKNVKSKVAVAKTQERLNKITSSMEETTGSMQAFERMEAKANKMLDEADAMAELNSSANDESEDIEAKYTASNASVDEELAKLKSEMGL